MKKELQDKLTLEFPNLFRDGNKYNFQCGDGWFDLLRRLFIRLTEINLPMGYKIVSVKQKYAALNVWGHSDLEPDPEKSQLVHDVISEFEQESFLICEQCGTTRGIRLFIHEGWESVGCRLCRVKIKAGWSSSDKPHPKQEAVESMMNRMVDKFKEEIDSTFPEGAGVKIVLSTQSNKSNIIVKTPDGKVCGI